MRKILWVIETDNLDDFVGKAKYIGADTVCIRTTNDFLLDSIPKIQDNGLKVFGWRWPAAKLPSASSKAKHWFADDEANFVVGLISKGLDGYVVDPESDNNGGADDWDSAEYAPVAARFCEKIKTCGKAKDLKFHFGLTSGCSHPTNNPNIPWFEFTQRAEAVYPQLYWSPDYVTAGRTTPEDAYRIGMASWKSITPAGMKIRPIMGEITNNKPDEIDRFGKLISGGGLDEVNFYTYEEAGFSQGKWDAMRDLGMNPLLSMVRSVMRRISD